MYVYYMTTNTAGSAPRNGNPGLIALLNDPTPRPLTPFEIDRNEWTLFGNGQAPQVEDYDVQGRRK